MGDGATAMYRETSNTHIPITIGIRISIRLIYLLCECDSIKLNSFEFIIHIAKSSVTNAI